MRRILLALALSAAALPALAMGPDTMSCADFGKLDDAGRMTAMAPAEGGMMASGDTGGMMASGDTGGMMAAGDEGGMMASDDHGVAAATAACAAHPDMTVGEAMKAGG